MNNGIPKILVVEDQNIVAIDLEQRLKSLNYEVVGITSSGAGAIKKAEETDPDLIIMDIMLKGDMDGISSANQIKKRFDIPIIYLTAYSDETSIQRAKITEPFGYLLKPFDEKELQITIEMTLYRFKTEKELKKRKEHLKGILKDLDNGIISFDQNLNIKFINKKVEDITGYKSDMVINKNINEMVKLSSLENISLINSELLDSFDKFKKELKIITSDGNEKNIITSLKKINNNSGDYFIIISEKTDNIENSKSSENKNNDEIINKLNNLITMISGNISLSKLKSNEKDKLEKYLENAEKGIFELNDILFDILNQ